MQKEDFKTLNLCSMHLRPSSNLIKIRSFDPLPWIATIYASGSNDLILIRLDLRAGFFDRIPPTVTRPNFGLIRRINRPIYSCYGKQGIHRTDRRFKSEHHFPVSGLSSPLQGRGSYFLAVVCDDADLCSGNDLYRATHENNTAFGFCDLHLRNPIHIYS